MKAKITVLCENSVVKPGGFIGEHGFSALVERSGERVLFDTGQGYTLVHNARVLGIDLASIGKVALSHGHNDHTGGLAELLRVGPERYIYAHPGIFDARYYEAPDGPPRPIGMPFTRSYLEGLGARFELSDKPQKVVDGITTSGVVPRETDFETGDTSLLLGCEDGTCCKDPIADDLSLIVEGEEGLVVLLGYAHAGLVNILNHVRDLKPDIPIKAVIGGTHLGLSSEVQMAATIEAMVRMGVERVGASHCTGLPGAARLREALRDSFFFAGVGSVLEV